MDFNQKINFCCNICGTSNVVKLSFLDREQPTCAKCFSNVRLRSLMYLLSTKLFSGEDLNIGDFPVDKSINGVSLSCPTSYASKLAEKFNYKNTFYHTEPRLDINNVNEQDQECMDFVICSEVLEHTNPPVLNAFLGLSRLLKPGGLLVFTVPFTLEADCFEHFPELHDFTIEKSGDDYILYNTTLDGTKQIFKDLIFHGGPGQTIELRLFSKRSIEKYLQDSGFVDVEFFSDYIPGRGIFWEHPWSIPIIAKRKK